MFKSDNSYDGGSTDTDCAETCQVKKSAPWSKGDREEKEREPLQKGVIGYLKKLPKKTPPRFKKHKSAFLYAPVFSLLVILIVALIIVIITTRKSTDEVTETKCQKCVPCEDGWIWYRGKCYYFSTEYDTWKNSERFCKSHDASLALIDNKEELDFVYRYKGKENHWIGLRRTEDNTAWTWTNGTLYNESLFKVQRSFEGNIEYAYLNTGHVRSQEETTRVHWICTKI